MVDFRFDRDLSSGRDLSIWANASFSTLDDLWMTDPKFQTVNIPGFDPARVFAGMEPMRPSQKAESQSLVGRYRWLGDSGIESSVQLSANRSGFEVSNVIKEERLTFDIDYQSRYSFAAHDLLWGFSHRSSSDDITVPGTAYDYLTVQPTAYTQRNSGIFLHDDWTLLPETLKLGLGVRWDHASRNGSYVSPNATLLWTPSRSDSLWLKYAKAPRTVARAEQDVSIFSGVSVSNAGGLSIPTFIFAQAGSQAGLRAERTQGVEVGYRKQFAPNLSGDISLYRYHYSDLRGGSLSSINGCSLLFTGLGITYPPTNPAACPSALQNLPVYYATSQVSNSLTGWSNGAEITVDWLATPNWRLQLSYSWSRLDMNEYGNAFQQNSARLLEKSTPRHHGSLRSQWNIDNKQQLDLWLRTSAGFERLDAPYTTTVRVPGYATLDLRYAYRVDKNLEVALIGRNLVGARRFEYVSDYLATVSTAMQPSLMLTSRWTF